MIGILNLNPDPEEETDKNMLSSRSLENHCKSTQTIDKSSVLGQFIDKLDQVDYES